MARKVTTCNQYVFMPVAAGSWDQAFRYRPGCCMEAKSRGAKNSVRWNGH